MLEKQISDINSQQRLNTFGQNCVTVHTRNWIYCYKIENKRKTKNPNKFQNRIILLGIKGE